MTPQDTWDSCKERLAWNTAATKEARGANSDTLMPLHGRQASMARPPFSWCRRPSASPGPAYITLVLLLCSLVQLRVAALQLPASSPTTSSPQRLHNDSRTLTQQAVQGGFAAPPPGGALGGWRVSVARKAHLDQPEGTRLTEAGTTASTADAMRPRYIKGGAMHSLDRTSRSITTIQRIELHGPPLPDRKTLFVEVVVLADYSFYNHYGTRHDASQRAAQLLSVANKVLGGVGVMLVPAKVSVWDSRDQFSVTSTVETNVDGLQQYRLRLLQEEPKLPNDHTVLLTRKQMRGRVPCGAPQGGMCRRRESVSVVQDEGEVPSLAGVALAHAVGHSLGFEDDADDADHDCGCHDATCVMGRHFRNASAAKLEWSSCNRKSLSSAMDSLALDCLRNVPRKRHDSNSCGDGVVDDGEQCDCGPAEFCDNPCCVADTCRLATNASCASGACCDTRTCQPKPPGTVCRAAPKECDLPEFCSGHSEYCPTDVNKGDGTSCRGGEGHCYNGECGSREGRCEQLWGASTPAASHDCYSEFNVKGNRDGNCGFETGVYRTCRPENSLCGTLHCLASAPSAKHLPEHRPESRRAGPHECHFISGSANYPAHHWLTPSGASCGSGKMCVNQRCQEIPKPTGDCRGGCSGHGVCNSRGNCHCDAGYSPPDCSLAGLGGSVESNVMAGPSDVRVLITSMWVLLVLLASLLAVTCCSWGCFKGWYKSKGRDYTSRALPCCVACLDTCCCPIMTKAARWMLTVRFPPQTKQSNVNIEAEGDVNEHMLCSVDVDIKGTSHTNSWGVANEKLVTEMVTITPKNSPDLRRKVRLPSDSPVQHHKSHDNLQRPKYLQSISMDSGCVSDTDEDDSSKRSSLQLSMSSLISTFRKIGNKNGKATTEKEIHLSKNSGSQKSIPLSRLVVDPLAGGRSSRQATPPPEQAKPAYCRSISTDILSTGRVRARGTPPPPPPSTLKPAKSEENLSMSPEMPSGVRFPCRQNSPPGDRSTPASATPKEHAHTTALRDAVNTNGRKVALRPPIKKALPLPPRVPPSRHNSPSPPQIVGQRNQEGRLQGKPSPPREAAPPTLPSKPWSEARSTSPGSSASKGNNKVLAIARKLDAA